MEDVGQCFDTISICFSKGLGCPMCSILAGSRSDMQRARRIRKLFGGALRQAGMMAAAAIYALDNHVTRLQDDHDHARQLAKLLADIDGIHMNPNDVETNLLYFQIADGLGSAVQLDNAVIEMDAAEAPGADGSARPFVDAFVQAGLVDQKVPRKTFVLDETVSVSNEGGALVAMPAENGAFGVSYTLDYAASNGRSFPVQHFEQADVTPEVFAEEIAPARTFCLESEAEQLRTAGLGQGANYQNTLVISDSGGVIENELRFPDEFARHKALDLIGDLCLLEADLKARLIATKTGHDLNQDLVGELARLMHER